MSKQSFTVILGALWLLISPLTQAAKDLPPSIKISPGEAEEVCPETSYNPSEWRKTQIIDGVQIQESQLCNPDNPYDIAAFVKGTNNISMDTLMNTQMAADSIIKKNDVDGDGDPDFIIIKLEVVELNGHSPDMQTPVTTFKIAPGIQPTFWVFAPKTRDMSTESLYDSRANPLLRLPSPTIRVEQDDVVWLVLENTHYLPHSIHLHGIDHPYMDHAGIGNDGVGQTSNMDVMPGESKTYVIKPRQPGTMYYHCHVQPHTHIPMGLQGLFVVEENKPNNWVQTFNIGDGQVRHPSVAVSEKYAREYDLHYQSADKELHQLAGSANDPRLIAKRLNTEYDITDADDDYFMLNGRSFPYTLRESLIEMQMGQKVKLRILNGHTESLALHLHGHKPTITHYDGVDNGPGSYITRDVHGLEAAQRIDLELVGEDDGLHSFGEGVWMFHDHVEKSFTTNGIGEGGDISLVVYKNYLNERGIPSLHGMDLSLYFTEEFWQGKYPAWQNYDAWQSLGLPGTKEVIAAEKAKEAAKLAKAEMNKATKETARINEQQRIESLTGKNKTFSQMSHLLLGIFIGLIIYIAISKRVQVLELLRKKMKP